MKPNKPGQSSHLKDVIPQGWPEYPNECLSDLKESWNFREDLSVENGLILKGHRPLIASDLHTQMLQIIHQGHLGVEKFHYQGGQHLLITDYYSKYPIKESLPQPHLLMSSIILGWYLQRMEYQKPSGWYLTTGPSIHTVAAKNLQLFANSQTLTM